MQTNYEAEQLSMFGQDLWYGKMFPAPLVQERQRAKTSESFWRRSSALNAIPFQSLDLTPGAGNLLDEFYWEILSPWRGASLMLNYAKLHIIERRGISTPWRNQLPIRFAQQVAMARGKVEGLKHHRP